VNRRDRRVRLDAVIEGLRAGNGACAREYPLARRVQMVRDLCNVVDGAHGHGLSHPNLSASSVLVDDCGRIFVRGWIESDSPALAEADVHALGAIAYELLTLGSERGALAAVVQRALDRSSRRLRAATLVDRGPAGDGVPRARLVEPPRVDRIGYAALVAAMATAIAFGPLWAAVGMGVLLLPFFLGDRRAR
jgi:hypothetical protein